MLVFRDEIDRAVLVWQFGRVSPVRESLSIAAIVETIKSAYADKNLTLDSLVFPDRANQPYMASFLDAAGHYVEAFIIALRGLSRTYYGRRENRNGITNVIPLQ